MSQAVATLRPERAASPALRLVAVYRKPRFRNAQMQAEYRSFLSLALAQRRGYWECRKAMTAAEERGDLAYYRMMAAEAKKLWRAAKWHLHHASLRLEA